MVETPTTFAAYALRPGFGEEALSGTIACDRWQMRFSAEGLDLDLPLHRLQIELVRGKIKQICFSDPQQPGWSIFTEDVRLLREPHLLQQTHTRNQIRAIGSGAELKRALVITAGFVAGFAVLALIGSLAVGMMVRSLVARVPPAWEEQLGQGAMKELRKQLTFVNDPKLKAQLDQAVAPLASALPKTAPQLKFYIVEFPLPNACALPGGYVVVTTDLLALADRPEEIAGVVAHEVAHLTQKHGLRRIISASGPYLIFKMFAGDNQGLLGALGDGSQFLIRQSFSQEYELEADSVGWDYLLAAHVDPRGLTDMLMKLKGVQDSRLEMQPHFQAFSSHPATEKRIQRLDAKWQKLKEKSGFIQYGQPAASL